MTDIIMRDWQGILCLLAVPCIIILAAVVVEDAKPEDVDREDW